MAVRTGNLLLARKVILEFSAGPSGRENVSILTEAFLMLLVAVQMFILQDFSLTFQRRQFRPNLIFE